MERLKIENLDKDRRLYDVNDKYYNDLEKFAQFKLSYHVCFKCSNPYYGGIQHGELAFNDYEYFRKEELMCGKCAASTAGVQGL